MRIGKRVTFVSASGSLIVALACGNTDPAGTPVTTGGVSSLASGGTTSSHDTQTDAEGTGGRSGGTSSTSDNSTEIIDTSVAGGSSMDIKVSGGRAATGGSSAAVIFASAGGAATGGTQALDGTRTLDATGSGGLAPSGGMQGTGGTSASPDVKPSAVDVLFMIDNSASMADKQGVLATSLPSLLGRLAQPNCLDPSGKIVGQTRLDGTCAQGTQVSAKAYPGLREIAVLRDYARGATYVSPATLGNSIVTSICAKDTTGAATNASFGYNPATDAIVSRLAERLPKD